MRRKGSVLLALAAASVLALGAVPSSSSADDLGDVCASLIGNHTGTLNLGVANVNYATCNAAIVPKCTNGSQTINLSPLAVANIAICNPITFR